VHLLFSPGETVDKRYTCTKAADVRDAVAKELYAKMFQWIVLRLNAYLQPRPSPDHLNIGRQGVNCNLDLSLQYRSGFLRSLPIGSLRSCDLALAHT